MEDCTLVLIHKDEAPGFLDLTRAIAEPFIGSDYYFVPEFQARWNFAFRRILPSCLGGRPPITLAFRGIGWRRALHGIHLIRSASEAEYGGVCCTRISMTANPLVMSSSGAEMYTYFLSLLSHSFDAEKGVETSGSAFRKLFPIRQKPWNGSPFF